MTRKRLELQTELENVLGSKNVYWQPPENIKLKYPCIVYEEDPDQFVYANNAKYRWLDSYSVTLIRNYSNRDETSKIVEELESNFEYISPNQHFISDNLIHDVFKLYY